MSGLCNAARHNNVTTLGAFENRIVVVRYIAGGGFDRLRPGCQTASATASRGGRRAAGREADAEAEACA